MSRGWRAAILAVLLVPAAAGPADAQSLAVHLGVASCAGDNCHGAVERKQTSHVAQDEYLIWAHKDKHSEAFAVLGSERGKRIAANLGVKDAKKADICLDCHADNVPPQQRGPQFQMADGVGCESCHGGASGWLGVHLSGVGHAANLAAGLYPLEQPLARAERCLGCHLGDQQRAITHRIMGAGHPPLGFELDTYSAIEPAHYHITDDYIARKGRPDDIQIWAVGQAIDVKKRMALLLDPKNAPKGLQPELVLFDCQACHHPMDRLQWQARASMALPPGSLRLYDATAAMLEIAASRIAPELARELHGHVLALQRATTEDWASIRTEAGSIDKIVGQLLPLLVERKFGRDDAIAIAKSLVAASDGGTDYSTAQQQTMAIASIVAAMRLQRFLDDAQIKALNDALNGLYDAVANSEAYQPSAFAQALRQFAAKLPP